MMNRPFTTFAALLRRIAACRSGSASVEMGIVLPILTTAIMGTIYAGWLFFSLNVMYFAVDQAARCAAINAPACQAAPLANPPATQAQQTANYAVSMTMGLNVTAASFTVAQAGCGMQVSYDYTFTFPVPFTNLLNLSFPARACYPIQPS
jgi:Flp pilus assembly protein TadG